MGLQVDQLVVIEFEQIVGIDDGQVIGSYGLLVGIVVEDFVIDEWFFEIVVGDGDDVVVVEVGGFVQFLDWGYQIY